MGMGRACYCCLFFATTYSPPTLAVFLVDIRTQHPPLFTRYYSRHYSLLFWFYLLASFVCCLLFAIFRWRFTDGRLGGSSLLEDLKRDLYIYVI